MVKFDKSTNVPSSRYFKDFCKVRNIVCALVFLLSVVFAFYYYYISNSNIKNEEVFMKKRKDATLSMLGKQHNDFIDNRYLPKQFIQLQDEIDKLFNNVFFDLNKPLGSIVSQDSYFVPKINISENEKEYIITADIPGVDQDNIILKIKNGTLSISGEKKFEKQDQDENYHRIERSYGSFDRRISIPDDADEDNVSAEFENGVLKIKILRDEDKKYKTKQIDIKKS